MKRKKERKETFHLNLQLAQCLWFAAPKYIVSFTALSEPFCAETGRRFKRKPLKSRSAALNVKLNENTSGLVVKVVEH